MQELLCSPLGEMWLKFVSVKWNCAKTLNPTSVSFVHVYASMHIHIEKSTSVYFKNIYKQMQVCIQVLILCCYPCMAADVLPALVSKGKTNRLSPWRVWLFILIFPVNYRQRFLHVKPELSSADGTCLMAHSDKTWIISTFFLFRLLSEIPHNPGVLRLGRWKIGTCDTQNLKSVLLTVEKYLYIIKLIEYISILDMYWFKIKYL